MLTVKKNGEISTILILISLGLLVIGTFITSVGVAEKTQLSTKAVISPVSLPPGDINAFCLGEGGETKIATSYCIPWGQGSPFGGAGRSIGSNYCCQTCNPNQAGSWTLTCYRPDDQAKNYQGPCNSDAGVAFPLVCMQDPTDKKWKWVSQNDKGECNTACSIGSGGPVITPTPPPQPTPTGSSSNQCVRNGITYNEGDVLNYCVDIQCDGSRNEWIYIDEKCVTGQINLYPGGATGVSCSNSKPQCPGQGPLQPSSTPSPTPRFGNPQFPTSTPFPTITPISRNTPTPISGNTPTPVFSPTPTPEGWITDTPPVPTATPIAPPTNTPVPGNPPLAKCEFINGDQSQMKTRLDLIVLPDKYTDINEFKTAARNTVNNIKNTNLGTRLSKMNFWISTDLNQQYNVQSCGSSFCWNEPLAFQSQQNCNGDANLIITKTNLPGIAGVSTMGRKTSVILADFISSCSQAAPHEIGHGIAGLMDEYIPNPSKDSLIGSLYINCSSDPAPPSSPCPKWASSYSYPRVGCYQGCTYTNWYRPAVRNIMTACDSSDLNFDDPSLEGWDRAFKCFENALNCLF